MIFMGSLTYTIHVIMVSTGDTVRIRLDRGSVLSSALEAYLNSCPTFPFFFSSAFCLEGELRTQGIVVVALHRFAFTKVHVIDTTLIQVL